MDADFIIEICNVLGLNHGRPNHASKHIQISCPLAWDRNYHSGNDKNPSCSVTIDPDGPSLARCWSANCGFKGTFATLVKRAVRLRQIGKIDKSLSELLKRVRDVEKVDLSGKLSRASKKTSSKPKTFGTALASKQQVSTISEDRLSHMSQVFHPYAESRGITESSWERWEMRYDPRRKNIVFPVRAIGGALVGLVGRSVEETSKRNYPGLDKSRHLYGEHLLETGQNIVIVEGPIDCVKSDAVLRSEGARVVATLGEGFTEEHVRTIRAARPGCVYIFTDGDRAGDMIAAKINSVLRKHVIVKRMLTPTDEDPASLTRKKVRALYREAKRIIKTKKRSGRSD